MKTVIVSFLAVEFEHTAIASFFEMVLPWGDADPY